MPQTVTELLTMNLLDQSQPNGWCSGTYPAKASTKVYLSSKKRVFWEGHCNGVPTIKIEILGEILPNLPHKNVLD